MRRRLAAHGCIACRLIQLGQFAYPAVKDRQVAARGREFPLESRHAIETAANHWRRRIDGANQQSEQHRLTRHH